MEKHKPSNTGIIITLGPASNSHSFLVKAFLNGVSIVRRGLAYGTIKSQTDEMELIIAAAKEAGREPCIMDDSPGSRARVGSEVNEYEAKIGETIQLLFGVTCTTTPTSIPTKGLYNFIDYLREGDALLIADGQIKLHISKKLSDRLICIVDAAGIPFRPNRSINFPDSNVSYSCLTENDVDNLRRAATLPHVKYFALSFLENPEDVLHAKHIVSESNPSSELKIVAKIETKQGMKNLDEIAQVADGLMVARGDLKLEAPYHELLRNQLAIINMAKRYNKYCIVATQFMDSMLNSLVPSASDITSLGYVILSGADAVMVSQETAVGNYPLESIIVMHNIIRDAEELKKHMGIYID